MAARPRSFTSNSSRIEDRVSCGALNSVSSTGRPVISVSTSAASFVRPWRARKYGLSGSVRRATKARKAGKDAARNR